MPAREDKLLVWAWLQPSVHSVSMDWLSSSSPSHFRVSASLPSSWNSALVTYCSALEALASDASSEPPCQIDVTGLEDEQRQGEATQRSAAGKM
jgi:hypothetical protein